MITTPDGAIDADGRSGPLGGPADTARLAQLHGLALDRYRADEALSRQAGGTPDDAALTLVASTLLNLDKALSK